LDHGLLLNLQGLLLDFLGILIIRLGQSVISVRLDISILAKSVELAINWCSLLLVIVVVIRILRSKESFFDDTVRGREFLALQIVNAHLVESLVESDVPLLSWWTVTSR